MRKGRKSLGFTNITGPPDLQTFRDTDLRGLKQEKRMGRTDDKSQ